jgi:hypothetical protein
MEFHPKPRYLEFYEETVAAKETGLKKFKF